MTDTVYGGGFTEFGSYTPAADPEADGHGVQKKSGLTV